MFVLGLAGLQAVVELAEELVERVSLGLVVPVAGGAAGVEVAAGTRVRIATSFSNSRMRFLAAVS
ncbi:MAG: hypothetical protein P4L86_08080 [Mycobacterium sp.]|nr:hypothetical protein [Mycobacterium sp.]